MSTDLRRGLADLASASGDYTDAAAAVAAARRHRRRMVAVPVACVLAVTLVAAVVAANRPAPRAPAPVGPRPDRLLPGPTRPPVELVLPRVVTSPAGGVPSLPVDRAVGRGVLVYRPCPLTCPAYLVTVSGAVYWFDVPHYTPGVNRFRNDRQRDLEVSLSPDGRYLSISRGTRTTVRDLTGTAAVDLSLENVVVWSPNDRYVANFDQMVDLWTGTVTPHQGFLNALTDGGGVVNTMPDPDAPRTTTISVDTSAEGRVLDAAPVLDKGEVLNPVSGTRDTGGEEWAETAFGPGGAVALTVFHPPAGGVTSPNPNLPGPNPDLARVAVAIGDQVTGKVSRRAPLLPHASAPFFLNDRVAYATQAAPDQPIMVYGIDADGSSRLLSQLPGRAEYVIAGMNGPYGAALGEAFQDPMAQ